MAHGVQHATDPELQHVQSSDAQQGAASPPHCASTLGSAALLATAAATCLLSFVSQSPHPVSWRTSWDPAVAGTREHWQGRTYAQSQQAQCQLAQAAPPLVLEHLLVMITFNWDILHLASLALVRCRAMSAPLLHLLGLAFWPCYIPAPRAHLRRILTPTPTRQLSLGGTLALSLALSGSHAYAGVHDSEDIEC